MSKSTVPISARNSGIKLVVWEWLISQAQSAIDEKRGEINDRRAELEALALEFAQAAKAAEAAEREAAGDGDAIAVDGGLAAVEADGVKYAAGVADQVAELAAEIAKAEAAVEAASGRRGLYERALEERGGKPATYWLRVPGYKDRTELNRDLAELGAIMPTPRQFVNALRAFVRENGDDAVEQTLSTWLEYADASQPAPAELVDAVGQIQAAVGPGCPEYRRLLAARAHYNETKLGIRCATLIVDYENVLGDDGVEVPYAREHGRMADRCLIAMGADVELVGQYIEAELAVVNGAQAKNSASRSPSPSGRNGSQAA